jgi:hypothetical protein
LTNENITWLQTLESLPKHGTGPKAGIAKQLFERPIARIRVVGWGVHWKSRKRPQIKRVSPVNPLKHVSNEQKTVHWKRRGIFCIRELGEIFQPNIKIF